MLLLSAGVVASTMLIVLALAVNRNTILAASLILNIACLTQYWILGSSSAVFITIITLAYMVSTVKEHDYRWIRSTHYLGLVVLAYIVVFIATEPNPVGSGMVILAATLAGFVPLFTHDKIMAKTAQIIAAGLFLTFSIIIGAHGQIPGQIINGVIATIMLTYVVYYQRKNPGAEAPELTTFLMRKTTQEAKHILHAA